MLRAAYDQRGKVSRADFDHTLGNLEGALGECLLTQKRYAEAEELLLAGYDDLKLRLSAQNRLAMHDGNLLHELYTVWDKPALAARFASQPGHR